MKTMTCKQLGGACEQTFSAATFEEMAGLNKEHGKETFKKNDAAHLEAMRAMQLVMETPNAMQDWFKEKKQAFDTLPED
ncbi:MAG: DUF1059 domain-containing protein [Flavobacteriaceae bacterium]|nr:DUF1059 domain-containing protein [Flavobacteriaceae bacterium]